LYVLFKVSYEFKKLHSFFLLIYTFPLIFFKEAFRWQPGQVQRQWHHRQQLQGRQCLQLLERLLDQRLLLQLLGLVPQP